LNGALLAEIKSDPGFQKLIQDRSELKFLIEQTKNILQPGARPPLLVEKEKKLADLDRDMVAYIGKIRPDIRARLRELAKGEGKSLSDKVILLRGMQEAIVSDINRLDKELSDVSKGNLRLESVRQEKASYQIRYDRNQEVIRNLTSLQKAEARVQMDE